MAKYLYIPNSKQYSGLTVYCNKCKTTVTDICRESGKKISQCSFPEKHRYKYLYHIPGSENDRVTRTIKTRDLDEALNEAIQYKKEFGGLNEGELHQLKQKEVESHPQLLIAAEARYLGYMSGDKEIVSEFFHRQRSTEYVKDIERGFQCFNQSLVKLKLSAKNLKVADVDKRIIGGFCSYMETLNLANRTFNKYIGYFTSFYNWLIQVEGYSLANLFQFVRRKATQTQDIEIISMEEYNLLLEKLDDKELGKHKLSTGEIKNLWKPWLKPAVQLALLTGRRAEELFQLKFSDIKQIDGIDSYMRSEDIKVNNMHNLRGDNRKFVFIPITEELKVFLLENGYEQYKGKPICIIAHNDKMKQAVKTRFLWRAFAHYYNQLETGRPITFKSLRKTYITELTKRVGIENARMITGHSGVAIMQGHYINLPAISSVAKNFNVFRTERKTEMLEKN